MSVDEKAMRQAAIAREKYRGENFYMQSQQESDRVFLEAYEAAKDSNLLATKVRENENITEGEKP